ncbi:unannotated protein [freshwater metagenome]|uniref:Unannotated protein n=1 Tax=freshwater metagenome TaxID=449393 RepID=A0A6J7FG33_9ZZZZ|nr:hypothetical protein [Actinomycetota bacterium]
MIIDALLVFFAFARIGEGIFCARMAFLYRRWAVLLWGIVTIALAVPVVAYGFGWDIPRGPAAAIAGGHAVLGMCVVAAMVSSTAEGRRVTDIARIAGFTSPTTKGWRP